MSNPSSFNSTYNPLLLYCFLFKLNPLTYIVEIILNLMIFTRSMNFNYYVKILLWKLKKQEKLRGEFS